MTDEASPYVILGKVIEPYGILGWLKLRPFADDPLSWRRVETLYGRPDGHGALTSPLPWRAFVVDKMRAHGAGVVLKLMGVDDRTQADPFKGWVFGALREALPAAGDDEYYWADLIGLTVVNGEGVVLGRVAGLIATGANDVLQVVGDDGPERLLPFVKTVVKQVLVEDGRIEVEWGADW